VFIDGCFWHVCPDHGTWPRSNAAWWRAKLQANVERDRNSAQRLTEARWTVIRIWEHEQLDHAFSRVFDAVRPADIPRD